MTGIEATDRPMGGSPNRRWSGRSPIGPMRPGLTASTIVAAPRQATTRGDCLRMACRCRIIWPMSGSEMWTLTGPPVESKFAECGFGVDPWGGW